MIACRVPLDEASVASLVLTRPCPQVFHLEPGLSAGGDASFHRLIISSSHRLVIAFTHHLSSHRRVSSSSHTSSQRLVTSHRLLCGRLNATSARRRDHRLVAWSSHRHVATSPHIHTATVPGLIITTSSHRPIVSSSNLTASCCLIVKGSRGVGERSFVVVGFRSPSASVR